MIIDDLNYVEAVLGASKLIGAGYTCATGSAHTFATYGFGSADANAFAIGENTSTLANTYIKVSVSRYMAFTEASATANSYARTGNSYSVYLNDSRYLFISSGQP
ncbi:hypothetical protein IQ270_09590 [Microcoleus sp. LEGE 07076]|uniref:hypothetical protein n=1 Tax=Microcoleus sp. LEGE 07076 TaxID=915322 RepID=UPI00188268E1|nr:hypothetical protein [Microcoleus sp. LEGE 07076]MBE9184957.1 hypothetical protein [Microcoleus sp. LEGE 07076]